MEKTIKALEWAATSFNTATADSPSAEHLRQLKGQGLIRFIDGLDNYGYARTLTLLSPLGKHELDRLKAIQAEREAEAARIREEHGDEIDADEQAKVDALADAGVPLVGSSS